MAVVALAAATIRRLCRGRSDEVASPIPPLAPLAKTDRERRRPGRTVTSVLLLMLALSLGLIAWLVWPGLATTPKPPQIDGGVLLMHDYVELDGGSHLGLRASVEAEQWETGVPGVSILRLEITFDAPVEDLNWYVVASGDYAVHPDVPANFYCFGPSARQVEGGIECPAWWGGEAMRFDFDQQLGSHIGNGDVTSTLTDLNGYSDNDVTVVKGLVPTPDEYTGRVELTVELPISTPPTAKVSGNEFVRYGRIGFSDWEWGGGPAVEPECTRPPDEGSTFVLPSACAPLERVIVTSTRFDTGYEIGARTVEYSSPDVASDDRLVWAVDGPFPGGQALINDPFEEGQETRRSFAAGVLISLAVSVLALLIQALVTRTKPGEDRPAANWTAPRRPA